MTHIFHRDPGEALLKAVRGDGVYLYDENGKSYLDGSGGAAVSCLGHNHPRIIDAIRRQASQLSFAHTAFFSSEPAEMLADLLIAKAPPQFGKAYFVSGGSEAMEAALKMARAYHLARGEPSRTLFVSRRQSYHGNTLGALSVSGNPKRRAPYEPLLFNHPKIAPCYAYRHQRHDEPPEAYGLRAANELEAAILGAGPENVAAFVAETVVGATLGACPAVDGYFNRIRSICDDYGVLYIADEVMCGMGRTGTTFAFETDGATPDLITIAKGLAGGYQPIGAVLATTRIHDALVGGGFEHGHTYVGHPIACAAALAVQQTVDDENLLSNVANMGALLRQRVGSALEATGVVGDIRGRGLMTGIEFVANRSTKAPLRPSQKIAARLKASAMSRGLVCYPGSGTIDGVQGDHVLLAPPFIINEAQLEELAGKLTSALGDVLALTATA